MAAPAIAVHRTITVGEPPADAMNRFVGHFTPWFLRGGWRAGAQTPTSITYEKSSFHTWQIVVAVIGFPIGLIALLAEKRQESLTATFTENDGGTAILMTGVISSEAAERQVADGLDWYDPAVPAAAPAPAVN